MAISYSTEIRNISDSVDAELEALEAILDCARLAASPHQSRYQLVENSLADLLTHAIGLVQSVKNDVDVLQEMKLSKEQRAQGGAS